MYTEYTRKTYLDLLHVVVGTLAGHHLPAYQPHAVNVHALVVHTATYQHLIREEG